MFMATPPDGPREVFLPEQVVVAELAEVLSLKPFRVIADLMDFGIYVAASHSLDFNAAANVCSHHGAVARRLPDSGI